MIVFLKVRRARQKSLFLLALSLFCTCPSLFSLPQTPALLMGIVTNGVGGAPVIGARITVNGKSAWSASGGIYSLSIDPLGTFPVACAKAGFDTYTSTPVVFQSGVTTQMNISLSESLNPVTGITAALDPGAQAVSITWTAPSAPYELLYDDGIQDNFTVWAAQGNMNAVRFTPVAYPVRITGGSVHIGTPANYAAGTNPGPFLVSVFDASGSGGTPGNSLAGPFTVTPAGSGWIEFAFVSPVQLASGSFYLVMTQVGSPPSAAGLAIDETAPQFRSYARFVTGSGPWYPAGGNYMIRARCDGPGGPVTLADQPLAPVSYSIYRLRQGEEQNPTVWTTLATQAGTAFSDTNWLNLPCGPYRWGIKTQYPGNRWSVAAFSNIIGKCWTAPVTIHIDVTCQPNGPEGTSVRLVNMAYPDTLYAALCDTSGTVSFPTVWKGNYQATITRFAYDTLIQNIPVTGPVSTALTLMQTRIPPVNLVVNDTTLKAHWDVPHYEKELFSENWSSGTFTARGWTLTGGNNWQISTALGNPAPCAIFGPSPQVQNYTQTLVSKTISGERSTLLRLKYDIFLNNVGTTTVNQLAVEIWNGSAWQTLKNHSSAGGSFPWTGEEVDISGYTDLSFKLRFRAYGGDSFDLGSWDVDNIRVIASDPAQQQANCILGYYFYLGNMISGYTAQNAYTIPPGQVQYGQTYTACVRALYGSGYSDFACDTLTSRFLYPVRNLTGVAVENAALLTWDKPQAVEDTIIFTPPGLTGYKVYRDNILIAQIPNADTLSYYDNYLESGLYHYGVSAVYDLASYGYPGQAGESQQGGPVDVTISYGRPLPFFESWDHGNFSFNEWRFTPSQGNWIIDPNEGLPSPAAGFRWQPPQVNYSFSLESPQLNAVPFNCAAIWLDFDLKLNDRNATSTEKLIVEAYYNHEWHKKAEIKNAGNLPWTNYHLDISPVHSKGFRVRFRAEGQNSSEILTWYVDNVSVYAVCYPAAGLSAFTSGDDIHLSWAPPACFGGNLLNEPFEEPFFPPAQWSVQTYNTASTWSHHAAGTPPGVHNGNYSAALEWDYGHQDEWLIAHNVYVNGDLTFWSYAFQGSLHQDHYYVKISLDQGSTWDVLLDMSALPPYPGSSGVNAWNTPYHIDLSSYAGATVDLAWQAVDGDGNGLWYPWAIDDCSIGADDLPVLLPGGLLGYDIFRKNGPNGSFTRVNSAPVTDTTYTDMNLLSGQYRYFVQSVFAECQNAANSDTILVDLVTSAPSAGSPAITLYPNPVTGFLNLKTSGRIEEIRLVTVQGVTAAQWTGNKTAETRLDLRPFSAGIYLLKVRIEGTWRTFKICLTGG